MGTRSFTETGSGSSASSQPIEIPQTGAKANAMGQLDTHASYSRKDLKSQKSRNVATDGSVQTNNEEEGKPVLFLSVHTALNESIARAITAGMNDKDTFQCLCEAYQSISCGWWRLKRVTGIKFYRVRSKFPIPHDLPSVMEYPANIIVVPQFSVQRKAGSPLCCHTHGQGAIS